MQTKHSLTLVLGASGKTGRRIISRLEERGVPVREGSRSGEPSFQWEDRSTWAPSLTDVATVYISYYPDLTVPSAPGDIAAFTKLAKEMGITKVVLLSGRGEEEAQKCEQIVQECGIDWTIVRCAWFNQNFSENFIRDMIMDGIVALPAGTVREPFVDTDDIADVAVVALTDEKHNGQLYELTGPRMLTFSKATNEISKATGRDIKYIEIPGEAFVNGLKEEQLPVDIAELLEYLFITVLDGRNEYLTDGVRKALGREPKDFADYAKQATREGYWNTN